MGSNESLTGPKGGDGPWLAGVFAILLTLYFATILSFYNVISEEGAGQSHAPLLLAVTIYLLYRAWSRSGRQIQIDFNHLATLALAVLSLTWLALGLVFIEAGQQAVLILIVAVTVVALLGVRPGAKYLMPILLLWTVLPIYEPLVPTLQTASAVTSALVLELIGLTSIREGFLLVIPNGTFEVADECSGLKFQIIGVTLALIHTQLSQVSARVTIIYVLLASLLAFVSNVLRIVIVVLIGYFYGMDHEYVKDHDFIGWILFSLFFFLYIYIGERKLRKNQLAAREFQGGSVERVGVGMKVPGVAAVILAFAIGPLMLGYFMSRDVSSTANQLDFLSEMPTWRQTTSGLTEWTPLWTKGNHSFEGSFMQNGEQVDLFATAFQRQQQGNEAVNVRHRVYDIEKWSRISRSAKVVSVSGVGEVEVEETLLRSPTRKQRLVWLWYRTNDKIVSSPMQAKLNNLIGEISGKPGISVFVLSKEIMRNQRHASEVLELFFESYVSVSGGST